MGALRASVARGLIVAFAAFWLQTQAAAVAADLSGRVVGVADGDTLTLLTEEKRQVRVRLAGIDTPERAQPYGTRARQELSDLAFGKEARVGVEETDRYGRTVGRVHAGGLDVNAEVVRRGAAWVYRRYNRDPGLPALEPFPLAFEESAGFPVRVGIGGGPDGSGVFGGLTRAGVAGARAR